jgi:hypothetical protein
VIPTAFEIGVIAVALVVVVLTRGRLGYDRYRTYTAVPGTTSRVSQGPVPSAT